MNNLTNEQWTKRLSIKKEIVCSAMESNNTEHVNRATGITVTITSTVPSFTWNEKRG